MINFSAVRAWDEAIAADGRQCRHAVSAFHFLLSQKASQQLEASAVEDLHNQSTGMVDMVQMFNTSLSEEVESYTRLFTTFLPQPLNIDTSQAQTINGLSVPLLKGGDTGLHENNTLSDDFLNRTGAIDAVCTQR
jgi:hypothetical protein